MRFESRIYRSLIVIAVPFMVACSSIDEDFTGEEQQKMSVLADINISIPSKVVNTRQSANAVQSEGNFRGIEDIYLLPYAVGKDNSTTPAMPRKVLGTDTRIGDRVNLPEFTLSDNSVDAANTISKFQYNPTHSRVYHNIVLPLYTSAFLFYGHAIETEAVGTAGNAGYIPAEFVNGSLAEIGLGTNIAYQPKDINFEPASIVANTLGTVQSTATAFANYLTTVANTAISGTKWSEHVVYGSDYHKFITMTAGSSANVLSVLQSLYNKYSGRTDALATQLITNIMTGVNEDDGTLSWKETYDNYPGKYNLPDGAAYVQWVEDSETPANSKFQAITTGTTAYPNTGVNTGLTVPGVASFAYPAALYYRANSRIKTHPEEREQFYSTEETWDGVLGKYQNDDASVTPDVRSIVLKDQIQYAVGRFDLKVATANKTNSADEEGTLRDAKDIPVTIGDNFAITGILIGNQRKVDFEFHPTTEDSPTLFTLYDKHVRNAENDTILLESNNTIEAMHTLVLETPVASAANDNNAVVCFALELQNNSSVSFFGHDDTIIPPGTKFYLIGKMDPKGTVGVTKPTTTPPDDRVFQQDYVTELTVTINSLAEVYNVVPDLGDPQITIGLTVEDWIMSTPTNEEL